jgi:hypothetical protein
MTSLKRVIYGLDASKYPARLGQPWNDDEILKMLTSIQKKKSIEEIAKEHERTNGSIRSCLRRIAVDYHFNNKMPIEKIQKYTGLSVEEINDAIKKKEYKDLLKKRILTTKTPGDKQLEGEPITKTSEDKEVEKEPTIKELYTMLKDIQNKLNMLLEKA